LHINSNKELSAPTHKSIPTTKLYWFTSTTNFLKAVFIVYLLLVNVLIYMVVIYFNHFFVFVNSKIKFFNIDILKMGTY